tara:strand:+ start:194 stop:502 length:309 start_codon:yes stop_codon:yes gene_type:complete
MTNNKKYQPHILVLMDGSLFIDAQSRTRTPEELNKRANADYVSYEIWMKIKEYPVQKVIPVGELEDKTTALTKKRALIDGFRAMGRIVRNNPKTEDSQLKVA